MSTEKTVWEMYSLGIQQRAPRMTGDIVCYPPPSGATPSLAEWPERARLICAAPDLLAACELALEWSDGTTLNWYRDVLPAVRAAVAKARGQNTPEPCSEPEPLDPYDAHDQSPTPDEPAPARKSFTVLTQTGERLFFTAESVEEYDGGLGFYVGTNMVGLVTAGRWTAYWLDDNG